MSDARPWLDEPDEDQFIAHGLQCVIHRNAFERVLCGYVGVPESHPLHGVHFRDLVPYPDEWQSRAIDPREQGVFNLFNVLTDTEEIPEGFAPFSMVFTAHGGIDFSEPREAFPHLWFFGFFCGHAGDYAPGMHEVMIDVPKLEDFADLYEFYGTYRTIDYVRGECTQLAAQLSEYVLDEVSRKAMQALLVSRSSDLE